MTRDWKPGDVAMVHGQVALVWDDDDTPRRSFVYTDAEGDPCSVWAYSVDARPLVVIDPDDRKAVERLAGALNRSLDFQPHSVLAEAVAAALADTLREFADPKPPRPDEPTGRYAVVEDAEGNEWVRIAELAWRKCTGDRCGAFRAYAEIDAVRVLSEGVR